MSTFSSDGPVESATAAGAHIPPGSDVPPESIGADFNRESREDYALRRVPLHFRKKPSDIGMTLTGAVWSVFSFATGGTLALTYGIPTTLVALAIGFVLGGILAAVITRVTARNGLDIDLLSRGLGFGFMGSAFSSLVYAAVFLMYAGFEGAFIASAVHAYWPGVNFTILAVAVALVLVPINWYGFRFNTMLQRVTWPLFIVGIVALVYQVFSRDLGGVDFGGSITASSLIPAVAVCLPVLTTQAMLVGDWSRFTRPTDVRKVQVIASGVAIGGVFLVEAPLGAFMAVVLLQDNPGTYAVTELGVWGLIWVVITQIRIQNMNYYSASLAMANFSARVFRFAPGRQFWILVTALVTYIATDSGILDHLLEVLTFCGVFLLAWAGTLVAGIAVGPRVLGLDLNRLEYRRGYLRNWGWPSMAGLAVGTAVGATMTLADIPDATYGPFLGQALAFVIGVVVYVGTAWALRGKWSLQACPADIEWEDAADAPVKLGERVATCVACSGTFIRQDMIPCPVDHSTAVCSVCASKDRACHPEHKHILFTEGLI